MADFQHALDLFEGVNDEKTTPNSLSELDPKTPADFQKYTQALLQEIHKQSTKAGYGDFLNEFTKQLLLEIDPKTPAQFQEYTQVILPGVNKQSEKNGYVEFLREFTKQLWDPEVLTADDTRSVVNVLNTTINKKLQVEKGKKSRGKAKGAKVNVKGGGGGEGFEDHEAGQYDEYLDFM
eukprot:TRINITY_DN2963_c0_g1_i1.p1 TRINITY_DN2963_c0_g1~~TRINITY_DN2963_c0_g1_i1.p1  ORF type:complete len:179 (+),score=38.60 TRINITY_DN2963_c0_g1_i1:525-1061(+)